MRFLATVVAVCLCAGIAAAQEDLESLKRRVDKLREEGDFTQAMNVAEQALKVAVKQFGKDSAETAEPAFTLALMCDIHGGNQEVAERLYKYALKTRQATLGPKHVGVATTAHTFADFYASRGKHAEAEPLYAQAMVIKEAKCPDHPSMALTLKHLADLYCAQGKYAEAEPLFKRALAIREKALGPDHSDTAVSLNNLASLYDTQGKYDLAEPLYNRALEIDEKALGPDHPDTAVSLNNLALLYTTQGKYDLAEPLYKRALAICEKSLGPDHPHTVKTRNNLEAMREAKAMAE